MTRKKLPSSEALLAALAHWGGDETERGDAYRRGDQRDVTHRIVLVESAIEEMDAWPLSVTREHRHSEDDGQPYDVIVLEARRVE